MEQLTMKYLILLFTLFSLNVLAQSEIRYSLFYTPTSSKPNTGDLNHSFQYSYTLHGLKACIGLIEDFDFSGSSFFLGSEAPLIKNEKFTFSSFGGVELSNNSDHNVSVYIGPEFSYNVSKAIDLVSQVKYEYFSQAPQTSISFGLNYKL